MNFIYCTVGSLTYSVQKSFSATVFQNDDNSSILGQSCASLTDARIPDCSTTRCYTLT